MQHAPNLAHPRFNVSVAGVAEKKNTPDANTVEHTKSASPSYHRTSSGNSTSQQKSIPFVEELQLLQTQNENIFR